VDGLGKLVDGWEQRFAGVEACGVPHVLAHGDLHPGNVRTDRAGQLAIMDWGDRAVGHPPPPPPLDTAGPPLSRLAAPHVRASSSGLAVLRKKRPGCAGRADRVPAGIVERPIPDERADDAGNGESVCEVLAEGERPTLRRI
jgi:hypothetical protein